MIVIAVIVTLLTTLPIGYVVYASYADAGKSYFLENQKSSLLNRIEQGDNVVSAAARLADWCYLLLKRNDLGFGGLLISCTI